MTNRPFSYRAVIDLDPSMENHNNTVALGLIWDRKAGNLAVSSFKTVKFDVVTRRIMLFIAQ